MSIILNLTKEAFISFSEFKQEFLINNYLEETSNGVIQEQVVPKIYLSTDNVNLIDGTLPEKSSGTFNVLAMPGYSLNIFSLKDQLVFVLIEFNDTVASAYTPAKSNFYPFLTVSRENILDFEKLEMGRFYAINTKRSLAIKAKVDKNRVPMMGGLLGYASYKALYWAGNKATTLLDGDDLILSEGQKYRLTYIEKTKVNTVEIIVNQLASIEFDKFLSSNWQKAEPTPMVQAGKKEGCYIATCCYKSYDHPSVKILRTFRDDVLLKTKIGVLFVDFYYKHSPDIANSLSKYPAWNVMIKLFCLNPIIFLLRVFNF